MRANFMLLKRNGQVNIIKNHKYQVIENGDGCVDVLSEVAMNNAYLICHNVQVNIQPNKNNLQLSHFD